MHSNENTPSPLPLSPLTFLPVERARPVNISCASTLRVRVSTAVAADDLVQQSGGSSSNISDLTAKCELRTA